jgi:hypothetical protein
MVTGLQREVCPYCGYPAWGNFHIPGICPSAVFNESTRICYPLAQPTMVEAKVEDDGDGRLVAKCQTCGEVWRDDEIPEHAPEECIGHIAPLDCAWKVDQELRRKSQEIKTQ